MFLKYFCFFLLAFLFSLIFTYLVGKLSFKLGLIDKPDNKRKIHKKDIPLFGGLAPFLSLFVVLFLAKSDLVAGNLNYRHWLGFFAGGSFLMIGGFLDDKFNLKPSRQIVWPILAIICVILGGVGIERLSNPLGGIVDIRSGQLFFAGLTTTWWSVFLIFFWLLGMMYTTKILDGLDGLVTGIGSIGALVIFLFTMTTRYYQPDIGLASLIFAGSCFGFLVFNWNPARIFLGEGGSLFIGYALGVLSIISGGKIAIALLVMGMPILDVAWTIIRRLLDGKNPFKSPDRKHLHHKLLDMGMSQKKAVLFFYFLSASFGLAGLFLQSKGKMLALALLLLVMMAITIILSFFDLSKVRK